MSVANQKKKIYKIQSLYLCTNTQLMENKDEPEVLVQKCIYNFLDVTDTWNDYFYEWNIAFKINKLFKRYRSNRKQDAVCYVKIFTPTQ